MNFFDLLSGANHNLFRNKTRTFLTILAIFIGSFVIILNTAINAGVNSFIDAQVNSVGGDGFIMVFPASTYDEAMSMMGGGGSSVAEYSETSGGSFSASISNSDLEKLRAVDGVEELEIYHMLSPEWMRISGSDQKYNVSVEYYPSSSLNLDLSVGRTPNNDDDVYEIVINEDWLEPFGLASAEDAIGKTVEIATKQTAKCYTAAEVSDCLAKVRAEIVGVQAPGIFSVEGDLLISRALDQKLYSLSIENIPESSIENYIAVGNIDPDKLDSIRSEFEDLGYKFMTIDDEVGMIRSFLDIIMIVLTIFGAIALLAAAIGIINTLFMSVQERTREIGLEKALGMSSGKIFLGFSLEAILLGFWGSIVGILASMLIGYTGQAIAKSTFLADFPTFTLVKFEPLTMLIVTAIIMLIAFLAGTAPAIKAAKKNPIDALRYE